MWPTATRTAVKAWRATITLGRAWQPIIRGRIVDQWVLLRLHEAWLAGIVAGRPMNVATYLRAFDNVGDLSDAGRRRMPAMMRGADGLYLALTRRQHSGVRAASQLGTLLGKT